MQHPLIKLQGFPGGFLYHFSCFPVFPCFVYPPVSVGKWMAQAVLSACSCSSVNAQSEHQLINHLCPSDTQSYQSLGEAPVRDQWFEVSFAAHCIGGNLSLGWIRTRRSRAEALFHLPASSPSAHVSSSCNLEVTQVIKDSPVQILSLPSSPPLKTCCAHGKCPKSAMKDMRCGHPWKAW